MIATRTLVEALVRVDGTVDAGQLYTVAAALGMTDQQVRLCLKRLVAEGRFTHEGRGRRAVLRATSAVSDEAEFVRFAYQQDQGLQPWDHRWRLVAFAVTETARAARDRFRDTIGYLGGAAIQAGLYVSPNNWDALVAAEAHHLNIAANVTTLTSTDLCVGGERDPQRLAAILWPLAEIADRYTELARLAQRLLADLSGCIPIELLATAIELATEFTHAMAPDPLLPPELLPQPWPGTHARTQAARCFRALREQDADTSAIQLFQRYDSGDV
jgi:phenylacetic acid degradation operon negative regulatory protein